MSNSMGEAITDTWITGKVKSSFMTDSDIDGKDITVETNDGVVSLSGKVKTIAERDRVISKVREIKGVKSVADSGLTLG